VTNSITPPPELVQQLRLSSGTWLDQITNAYQAGADQELEACVNWLADEDFCIASDQLRAARRPKSPSLALRALHILGTHGDLSCAEHATLTRALLEALPD
jgi:hypothetical protein